MFAPCCLLLICYNVTTNPTTSKAEKKMATLIKAALIASAKKIILALLSEKVLTKLIFAILEEGAKRTDWQLDDKILAEIKDEFPKID